MRAKHTPCNKPIDYGLDASTQHYLAASVEQIDKALAETQDEIDGMAKLVVSLAQHVDGMKTYLQQIEGRTLESATMREVRNDVSSLDAVSNKAISRLQFATRLNRRLNEVQQHLSTLGCLLDEEPAEVAPNLRSPLSAAQTERLLAEVVARPPVTPQQDQDDCEKVTWLATRRDPD